MTWEPSTTIPGLWFHEATHSYAFEGRLVPSVTRVLRPLQSFDHIDPRVLESARIRGSEIHELLDRFLAPRDALPPYEGPWAEYISPIADFLRLADVEVLATEVDVYHPGLEYAGRADMVARFGGLRGDVALVDWKVTADLHPAVGPQTAAYAEALNKGTSLVDLPLITHRYALQLRPGEWKLHALDAGDDYPCFTGLLGEYNWNARRNGIEY